MMRSVPKEIARRIEGKPYTLDETGRSGSAVALMQDCVLKIEPVCEESENAAAMMRWLEGRLPAPRILHTQTRDGKRYTLMTRIRGEMACSPAYMQKPQELTCLLADALTMLFEADAADCPVSCCLAEKLRRARWNVEHGLVDTQDADEGTYGPGGFESPQALLAYLEENRPKEELVLSHGDFCLPNVFFENGCVSGLIDLGRAGLADKWQDIALCWRSLRDNANGHFGKTYEGFDPDILFEALGIAPDREKIRYYLLLDELF